MRQEPSRSDVAGKLITCSAWVQIKFVELEAISQVHTSSWNDESGPGRRYRISDGAWFWRLHPKQEYIAVGFPNEFRDTVRATGLLRAQKDAAWFNFRPDHEQTLPYELLTKALRALGAAI